jgi:hypothetical protein
VQQRCGQKWWVGISGRLVVKDITGVWDQHIEMRKSHELMQDGILDFRYYEYYNALSTT